MDLGNCLEKEATRNKFKFFHKTSTEDNSYVLS